MNITALFSWRKAKKQRLILEALSFQLRDPKSEASQRVQTKAAILANVWCMTWLDKKGIRHCGMCPSQETLRTAGAGFLCPSHFDMRPQPVVKSG